jgi:hypothetical protein
MEMRAALRKETEEQDKMKQHDKSGNYEKLDNLPSERKNDELDFNIKDD